MFIYFCKGESRVWAGKDKERGIHRIWSKFQSLSCQYRAQCRAWTHQPWDHDLSQSQMPNGLSHPGTPAKQDLFNRLVLCKWYLGLEIIFQRLHHTWIQKLLYPNNLYEKIIFFSPKCGKWLPKQLLLMMTLCDTLILCVTLVGHGMPRLNINSGSVYGSVSRCD